MQTRHIVGILFSIIFLLSMITPLLSAQIEMAPNIHIKDSTSSNWSGYAALPATTKKGQTQTVTDVKGSWTVPAVAGSGTSYSAFWVGIDGYSSNTVEQIGTDSNIINGVPQYSAWYEIYPKYPVTINIQIHPGDVITAEVAYSGKAFTLTINDLTTSKSFSTVQKCPQAALSSAEWIAEAPWSSGVLPLANFGTVTFTDCSATINGQTHSIGGFNNDQIDMVNSNGLLKADTGSLSSDGTSFSVTWKSST